MVSTPAREIGKETFEYPGTVSPVKVSIRDAPTQESEGIAASTSMNPRLKSWMSEALKTGLSQSPGFP